MEPNAIIGLLSLVVIAVVAAILMVRARRVRETEYQAWLDVYRATTPRPETDPSRLRELWTSDLRARGAAPVQSHAVAAADVTRDGVRVAPPMAAASTNSMAVLSFIFSALGGLLGIVFGHIALSQITTSGEGGRKLAIAGLVIGYGWIALFLGFLALAYTISSLNGTL
jgi:hypothetical protein